MSRSDQVDDILGGLSSPTAEDVYLATDSYDARALAAAAARRALAGGGGGGSQPTILTTKNLDAADILSLDAGIFELLPAPGGRFYYVPIHLVLHYRYGTTPYTGITNLFFGFGSARADLTEDDGATGGPGAVSDLIVRWAGGAGDGYGFLSAAADAYAMTPTPDVGGDGNSYSAWLATDIENKPLSICNDSFGGAPLAGGDGTLSVRILYALIDGAPA